MGEGTLVTDKYDELADFARLLEASDLRPRAMVYASYQDTADEKLLIVPASEPFDERELYRNLSILLSANRPNFPSIDISDLRIVGDSDPYVRGLASLFRVDRFSKISIAKSVLDGVYIEHAVVFRMVL